MKKTLFVLICLSLFLLGLSGCGCSHEWIQADCTAPKTCAQCAETEGEALGHDWQAASCLAAETCSRCGETQGDVLPHTYGEWTLGESEMIRTCSGCSAAETREIPPEVAAQQMLVGHWDFLVLFHEGSMTDPYRRPDPYVAYSAEAEEDGTFRLAVGEDKEYTLRWEYDAFDSEKNIYTYTMTREDTQNQATAYLQRLEGMDQLMLPFADGVQIFLFRDMRMVNGVIGTWRDTEESVDYILSLHDDRTFTGDVDGAVTGTWYLRPLKELNTDYYCIGLTLIGTRGEAAFNHLALLPVYGDPAQVDLTRQLQQNGFQLMPEGSASAVRFRWAAE